LIYDWTNPDDKEPLLYEATEEQLFEMINLHRWDVPVKFAAYEIGQCVVDWS